MSQVRVNFLGWRPDQDEYATEGLITAENVLHDTEGYKPLKMQTAGAFSASTWYSLDTLSSIRSMQIRAVGLGNNRMAAIAEDGSSGVADLSIGAEGEGSAFTSISTATLASAGGVRCKAFSVAELESGAFLMAAAWTADITGGASTIYSLTGEVTYTVGSESTGSSGSGATTSLEGTQSQHSRSRYNATVTSGVYLKSDGVEYAYSTSGAAEGSTLTSWLDSGLSSGVWVRCTLDSGSLDVDAGTGSWLQLNTSRGWARNNNSVGTQTAVVTLDCADDAAGSNIIDTQTYTLTSIRNGTSLGGTTGDHTRAVIGGPVYAGVHLATDGEEWAISSGGASEGSSQGNWLDAGSTSDLWVRCTLSSGTLDYVNSGTGTWLALTTARTWGIERISGKGTDTASITLDIATDSGGSNIIDTRSYSINATVI